MVGEARSDQSAGHAKPSFGGLPKTFCRSMKQKVVAVGSITLKKKFSALLLKQKYFYNLKIKVYPHNTLNSSKGVVRSPDLSLCTFDEIKNNLHGQGD